MIEDPFEKIKVVIEWDNGDETSFSTQEKASIIDAMENEFSYLEITIPDGKVNYINLNYVRLLSFEKINKD